MAQNQYSPFRPLVDQTSFLNLPADENLFMNYYGNNNGSYHNANPYNPTIPSLEDLEAEFLALGMSSSSAPLMDLPNLQHTITMPPPSTFSNNAASFHPRASTFFHNRIQSPFLQNGVLRIPHGKSLRMRSRAVRIGEDYQPIGPRNGHGYQHGRIRRLELDEVDYRALKKIIEGGNLREIKKIIELIKDHVHELMVDPFGNDLVQSLLEFCDESSINRLLLSLIKKENPFLAVCLHNLGYKALMKLLGCLSQPEQEATIALAISCIGVTLAKKLDFGHNLLRCCFLNLSREANELILLRIAQSSWELVRNQAGCCILQNCIKYAIGEVREALVAPLIQDAEILSKHAYGNYVIQVIIALDGANLGTRILNNLWNKFLGLSLNKFGSHVVEQCLSFCKNEADNIIFEIMDKVENWVYISTHEYGNFVAQRALSVAKGETLNFLLRVTKSNRLVLKFNPYGRKVIAAAKPQKSKT